MSVSPLFEAQAITKHFGQFTANDAIDFAIEPGEIHALLGENGAGKSTFVKMIYGVLQPDEGQFFFEGKPVTLKGPQATRQMGIGMVFQHFSQFEALTVAENIQLALDGSENLAGISEKIERLSASYGIPIEADKLVADLSVGEQQRVEILRCLLQNPKLLIMDEPTSVLTPQEIEQLFAVVKQLASEGCAILFISHKLDEILTLCPKATILRGGKKITTITTKEHTTRQIAEAMVGTSIGDVKRDKTKIGTDALLQVRSLNRPADGPFDTALYDINVSLYAGQILGIAGISGNGQDELMAALTGEWVGAGDAGVITIADAPIANLGPEARRQKGLGFIPEDRNGHAAVPEMSLVENTIMTAHGTRLGDDKFVKQGLLQNALLHERTNDIISAFDVRTQGASARASSLSGGNLQKFVVGREIIKRPTILIVSQPTWGVDVGAAQLIRQALLELAEAGSAIFLISQDLEEIFALSSHIAVLHEGHLSPCFTAADMTAEKVGLLMGGASLDEVAS